MAVVVPLFTIVTPVFRLMKSSSTCTSSWTLVPWLWKCHTVFTVLTFHWSGQVTCPHLSGWGSAFLPCAEDWGEPEIVLNVTDDYHTFFIYFLRGKADICFRISLQAGTKRFWYSKIEECLLKRETWLTLRKRHLCSSFSVSLPEFMRFLSCTSHVNLR